MKGTITDFADREALLRYLDLQNDISDIVNRYRDLGPGLIASTLTSKGYEVMATAYLPQKYQQPVADPPEASPPGADHD